MAHPLEAELGDVEHPLDAADIDEGAVVLDGGDDSLHHRADLEGLAQLGGALLGRLLEEHAARQDQVRLPAAPGLELGDAELVALADEDRRIFDEAVVELAGRAERAHAGHLYLDAALDDAGDQPLDRDAVLEGLDQLGLRLRSLRHHLAQRDGAGLAAEVDHARLDRVADHHRQGAVLVRQLLALEHALRLAAEIDEDRLGADRHDAPLDHVADGWTAAALLVLLVVLGEESCEVLLAAAT